MSLRELIDSECGLTNPLMKVASHFTQDKGLQAGQPSNVSVSDQLVKEFLLENNEAERHAPETFNMERLLHEMSAIDNMYHSVSQVPVPSSTEWNQSYVDSNALDSLDNSWGDEFLITSEQDIQNQRNQGNDWTQHFKAQSCSEVTEIATDLCESIVDPKISESKFMRFIRKVSSGEVALEQNEKEDVEQNEKEDVQNTSAKIWNTEFVSTWSQSSGLEESWENAQQMNSEFNAFTQAEEEKQEDPIIWSSDFTSTWSQSSTLDEAWEGAEQDLNFQTFSRTEDEKQEEAKNDADFWDTLQKEWEKMAKDETVDHPWLSDYESFDNYKEYTFTNDNPFMDLGDPFEEGLKKLESGDLPSAVLMFEAAVQKNPDHIEAWQYLGSSQAKNEQDPAAVSAFKRCLELDPENLSALMWLSVCYTNESMPAQACNTLIRWLHTNPKYSHLVDSSYIEDASAVSSILISEKHKAAQDMFIQAARINPRDPDPDVQNGLGVLFNLSGDYDKAIDCFKAALQVKPDDSLLWNRVGATLANNNQSDEAIEAYHRALELYPGFIRSRFNLGISCINLGAVTEAAEHFLSALNMQNAGRGPQGVRSKSAMSSCIWSTLRTVMTLLHRPDLYDAIDRKDLGLLNKEFGMEV